MSWAGAGADAGAIASDPRNGRRAWPSARARRDVRAHVRLRGQLGRDAERDQVGRVAAAREVPREGVVGPVHSPREDEIGGDDDVRPHARSF